MKASDFLMSLFRHGRHPESLQTESCSAVSSTHYFQCLCEWESLQRRPLGADAASPVGDARAGGLKGGPLSLRKETQRAPRQRLLPDALGFGAAVAAAAAAGAWAAALQLLEAAAERSKLGLSWRFGDDAAAGAGDGRCAAQPKHATRMPAMLVTLFGRNLSAFRAGCIEPKASRRLLVPFA